MAHHRSTPFKVLHLLGSVGHGGTENLFYDLAKWVEKIYDSRFDFAYYGHGSLSDLLDKVSVVSRLNCSGKICLLVRLRQLIKKQKVNIVHVHSPIHLFYISMGTIGIPIKKVLSIHGSDFCFKNKLKHKMCFMLADRVLFVSKSVKKDLLKLLNMRNQERFLVVYNGIDVDKIAWCPKNKILTEQVKLGMVGNFYNDVRDHLTLCQAASILKEKGRSFKLYFAGGFGADKKYYFEQCREYVKNKNLENEVEFLGFRDDIDRLIREWDLFVYSSNRDTFGIAVVEAMMSGTPVIVNDIDVFREITEEGKLATLYKTKAPEDLASKIEDFLRNPNYYQDKAKKASELARSRFSIDEHYKKLVAVYEDVAGR